MGKIIAADEPFVKKMWTSDDAIEHFRSQGERFKVEIIEDLKKIGVNEVSSYENGDFLDLCRGPHVKSTEQIGAYKLLSIAGAYWRGDRERTRSCSASTAPRGTTQRRAQGRTCTGSRRPRSATIASSAARSISSASHEDVGGGLIFWHPKLGMVRHVIETFWRDEHLKRGYKFVYTPHIATEKPLRRARATCRTTPTSCTRRWTSTGSRTASSR